MAHIQDYKICIFTCGRQKFLRVNTKYKKWQKTSYNYFSVLSKIFVEKFNATLNNRINR